MIKHAFHSAVSDGLEADKVQPSNWNAAHVIEVLTVDPVTPAVGDFWILATGSTPSRLLEWKFCDTDSVVVTLVSVVR